MRVYSPLVIENKTQNTINAARLGTYPPMPLWRRTVTAVEVGFGEALKVVVSVAVVAVTISAAAAGGDCKIRRTRSRRHDVRESPLALAFLNSFGNAASCAR